MNKYLNLCCYELSNLNHFFSQTFQKILGIFLLNSYLLNIGSYLLVSLTENFKDFFLNFHWIKIISWNLVKSHLSFLMKNHQFLKLSLKISQKISLYSSLIEICLSFRHYYLHLSFRHFYLHLSLRLIKNYLSLNLIKSFLNFKIPHRWLNPIKIESHLSSRMNQSCLHRHL